eukprot:PhM_4_TR18214/c0_g1_i1/m.9545
MSSAWVSTNDRRPLIGDVAAFLDLLLQQAGGHTTASLPLTIKVAPCNDESGSVRVILEAANNGGVLFAADHTSTVWRYWDDDVRAWVPYPPEVVSRLERARANREMQFTMTMSMAGSGEVVTRQFTVLDWSTNSVQEVVTRTRPYVAAANANPHPPPPMASPLLRSPLAHNRTAAGFTPTCASPAVCFPVSVDPSPIAPGTPLTGGEPWPTGAMMMPIGSSPSVTDLMSGTSATSVLWYVGSSPVPDSLSCVLEAHYLRQMPYVHRSVGGKDVETYDVCTMQWNDGKASAQLRRERAHSGAYSPRVAHPYPPEAGTVLREWCHGDLTGEARFLSYTQRNNEDDFSSSGTVGVSSGSLDGGLRVLDGITALLVDPSGRRRARRVRRERVTGTMSLGGRSPATTDHNNTTAEPVTTGTGQWQYEDASGSWHAHTDAISDVLEKALLAGRPSVCAIVGEGGGRRSEAFESFSLTSMLQRGPRDRTYRLRRRLVM